MFSYRKLSSNKETIYPFVLRIVWLSVNKTGNWGSLSQEIYLSKLLNHMHTKLTNEQKNKTWYLMKLLKIFAAKYMLYWEKKDQLIHLIWKKNKIKSI